MTDIERTPVEELYPGDIDAKSINREWDSEGLINEDTWNYHDHGAHTLADGTEVTVVIDGHGTVKILLDANGISVDPNDADAYLEDNADDEGNPRPGSLTEDQLEELRDESLYEVSEGPTMNYWYPCPRVEDDPAGYALKLDGLPLCVVEIEGEGWGLALTGGGMDLSWEIAEAYTRVGMLPPVHFADLPGMAGKLGEEGTGYIVAAMLRSLDIMAGWMTQRADWLRETYGELL